MLITLGIRLCREASAFRNSHLAARLSRVLLSRKSTVSPFGCVALHPTMDGGVVDAQPTLGHDLLEIAQREQALQVPADAEQDDVGCVVPPFEQVAIHQRYLSCLKIGRIIPEQAASWEAV